MAHQTRIHSHAVDNRHYNLMNLIPGRRRTCLIIAGILLTSSASAQTSPATSQSSPTSAQTSDVIAPERASGTEVKTLIRADKHMVAAAHPLATEAGLKILRDGGNAADALVAVQTVLGLVEPQSSGIGGGAFLVWYDAATNTVTTFDGRETAPMAATQALFLDDTGKALPFFDAVIGGRSVGTPGVVRLLETVHDRYGKKDWSDLFTPAIDLAENGFSVSKRMSASIEADMGKLDTQGATKSYFYDADGQPLQAGTVLKNPDYAATLTTIAQEGADSFYTGKIANAIIETISSHETNPGLLTLQDLAAYQVKERPAVCAPYHAYEVCGMGPPSSGAHTIGQILGIASQFDLATLGPNDPESWRIIGDATRLAFADRGLYIADTDFVTMPKGLLNQAYLTQRAELVRNPTALRADQVTAGSPPWDEAEMRIPGIELEQPSTTHFVIIDDDGNIASITSSVESAFGARQMAAGFILNNQLTDFNFAPEENGTAVANRVEPGKRPRSSMAPTIILHDGKPAFALGSPGGSSIIPYVATTIIGLIDWDMDMQQAISQPHLINRFGPYELEENTDAVGMAADLQALGFETKQVELNSGLHGIAITPNGLEGGSDPRREGIALGD